MKTIITGTGIGIPANLVRNETLAKIMDTSDEWIRTRSGVEQRYYADPGEGSVELGMKAAPSLQGGTGQVDADAEGWPERREQVPAAAPQLQHALAWRNEEAHEFDVVFVIGGVEFPPAVLLVQMGLGVPEQFALSGVGKLR